MKFLILTLSSFFLPLIFSLAEASCRFRPDISKIYSLSGPVTVGLKKINLLKDPAVKAISIFNPIAKEDFKGRRLPGGIFLGKESFSEVAGGIIFFDESRELSRILAPMSMVQGVEVKTRGLVPSEVTALVIKTLENFVLGCEKEFKAFSEETAKGENLLLSKITRIKAVLYFLGEYRMGRPPELLIVNDGIVKWLVGKNKITTYPSELAYVSWSAKVMNSLPKNMMRVAVKDSEGTMQKSVTKIDEYINLVYPGSLVPGITQLEAWNYLEDAL